MVLSNSLLWEVLFSFLYSEIKVSVCDNDKQMSREEKCLSLKELQVFQIVFIVMERLLPELMQKH